VADLRSKLTSRLRSLTEGSAAPAPAPAGSPADSGAQPSTAILDSYAAEPPSPQLAVDLFRGEWSSKFPDEAGIDAGGAPLFEDARITWMLQQLDVAGRRVLELGPLEGAHSWMLEQAGAEVTAVEANSRAFLKCLITKEVMGMRTTRFLLGDFVAHLDTTTEHFDVVLASGVLYHMREPLHLLDRIAAVTDRLVLWTHYFDRERLDAAGFGRQFPDEPTTVELAGESYTHHPRLYLEALEWNGFCGGPAVTANWLERDDLLRHLDRIGFRHVEIGFDDPISQNGPSILLLASKAE